MRKLRKELPPVNLAAVTCDSWSGMTGKLVPGSIIVCGMGSSTARGVKITGVCRSPPLPDGVGRRRLAALSGLPDSAARRQNFFGSYCITNFIVSCNDLSLWLWFIVYVTPSWSFCTRQTNPRCILVMSEYFSLGLAYDILGLLWLRIELGEQADYPESKVGSWPRKYSACWDYQ